MNNLSKIAPDAFRALHHPEDAELDHFDKRMAFDVIEDALTDLSNPNSRGMATGLCGALYMCGVLTTDEWRAFLRRIPPEHGPGPMRQSNAG